jgi:hypothetical protein
VNASSVSGSPATGTILNDDTRPTISIGDASVTEGNAGSTADLLFNVTLSNRSDETVTVLVNTADGSATLADNDYQQVSGRILTFTPGQISQTTAVQVIGDNTVEPSETLTVNLSGQTNSSLADAQGQGTIVNDDFATPTFTINDVTRNEGTGGTTAFEFTVTLSQPPAGPVNVTVSTDDGSATAADNDYTPLTRTLTFTAATLTQTVTINVTADNKFETDEEFFVNLSDASPGTAIGGGRGRGLIANDDAQPTITINNVSLDEGNSGTTAFVFSVSLSNPSYQDITVEFETADGTATLLDGDYQAATGVVAFPAGSTATQPITVNVNGDNKFELDETFRVVIDSPTNATIVDDEGLGTIVNDDAEPTISIGDVSQIEGNSGSAPFTFTVTLSNPSYQAVTATFQTADGTAEAADNDYLPVSSPVVIPAGSTTATIGIPVNGDTEFEIDQDFFVNLTSPSPGSSLGDGQGRGLIINDDGRPTISIADAAADEGSPTSFFDVFFEVTLSNPSDEEITVVINTADGTATRADNDYEQVVNQILTFLPGETGHTVPVRIIGDNKFEPDEAFVVQLSSPTNATLDDGEAQGTIRNDDGEPRISINDVSLAEGTGGPTAFVFTLTLSNPSSQDLLVQADPAPGTATAIEDYQAISGFAHFPAGSTTAQVTIQVSGDDKFETDETFFVNLSNASPGSVIDDSQGIGTILNDDAQPSISISDASAPEGNAGSFFNLFFEVTLSNPSFEPVTVVVNTADGTATLADSDYEQVAARTLTFNPGETRQTTPVRFVGDNTFEPDETFAVRLSNPGNGTLGRSEGQGRINNDEAEPTVTINDVSLQEGNSGITSFIFTLTLSHPSSQDIFVQADPAPGTATAGEDYLAVSGFAHFPPGATTAQRTIGVNGDDKFESDETFFVNLSNPSAGAFIIADNQGLGTILNDDAQPSVSIGDASAPEGNAGSFFDVVFEITLSNPSDQLITMLVNTADGTATLANSDYEQVTNRTVTFEAGQTRSTTSVRIVGDNTFEPDETYFLNLSGAVNASIADSEGRGTIVNDDASGPPDISPTAKKDDGEWGYRERGIWRSEAGGWKGTGTLDDVRTIAAGNGTGTATWSLAVTPGMYRVYATWTTGADRATNARYTILDGSVIEATVARDQQLTPDDGAYDGKTWESLGIYSIGTSVIAVQLSNLANGVVVADGIVAVPVQPLHLASGVAGAAPNAAAVDHAALQSAASEAIARWSQAGASTEQVQAMANAAVVIDDLPGSLLGLASSNVIWIDRDAAGIGWSVDFTVGSSNHVDLLTVVSHELGHVIGLEDDHGEHLMGGLLGPGVRHDPRQEIHEALQAAFSTRSSSASGHRDPQISALDAVFTLAGEEAAFGSSVGHVGHERQQAPRQSLTRLHEQRLTKHTLAETLLERRRMLRKLKPGLAVEEKATSTRPVSPQEWQRLEELLAQDQAASKRTPSEDHAS